VSDLPNTVVEREYPNGPQPFPLIIPLGSFPSQELSVTLGGRSFQMRVYTKTLQVPLVTPIVTIPPAFEVIDPFFIDIYENQLLFLGGVRLLNGVRVVRDSYLGFPGDLALFDLVGSEEPRVDGLGTRWVLTYWPNLT
jgi:hypothetical protein